MESEWRPTNSGDGQVLVLSLEAVPGYGIDGCQITARLNLNNPSAKAVEIARGDLSAICHSVNVMQVNDTEQLHGRPMLIKVAAGKPYVKDGKTSAYPEVKGYRPFDPAKIVNDGPMPEPAQAAAPAAATRPTGFGTPGAAKPASAPAGGFPQQTKAATPVAQMPSGPARGPWASRAA